MTKYGQRGIKTTVTEGETAARIQVPVSPSATMRETVGHVVQQVLDTATADDPAYIRFVLVEPLKGVRIQDTEDDEEFLNRVAVWAQEIGGEQGDRLRIDTEILGTEEYTFSPADVARILDKDAMQHDIDRVVLDPEYDPGINMPLLRPLEDEFNTVSELDSSVAPVTRPVKRSVLPDTGGGKTFAATFGMMFTFYLVLAGHLTPFNLVTGAVSAFVVAMTLANLSVVRDPTTPSLVRFARFLVYIPSLLFEVVKANITVAKLILHPRMPINPAMVRISSEVNGDLPITLLANSITLTPGTLTVRTEDNDLLIHALDNKSREGLLSGSPERWTQYIFNGERGEKQ